MQTPHLPLHSKVWFLREKARSLSCWLLVLLNKARMKYVRSERVPTRTPPLSPPQLQTAYWFCSASLMLSVPAPQMDWVWTVQCSSGQHMRFPEQHGIAFAFCQEWGEKKLRNRFFFPACFHHPLSGETTSTRVFQPPAGFFLSALSHGLCVELWMWCSCNSTRKVELRRSQQWAWLHSQCHQFAGSMSDGDKSWSFLLLKRSRSSIATDGFGHTAIVDLTTCWHPLIIEGRWWSWWVLRFSVSC